MDKIQLLYRRRLVLLLVLLALMGSSTSVTATGKTCWVDVFELAQYLGDHSRLQGPLSLPNLNNVDGKNWDSRIDSLIVGPNATVTLFENPNFKMTLTEMSKHPTLMESLGITKKDIELESELIFGANIKSHHLGEYNFHQRTRSLKIECP